MGTARVECVAGCACAPTTIDGSWERQESLMQIHPFKVRACGGGRALDV